MMTGEVSLVARVAVPLVLAVAWLSPRASILAFVIGAPLLPILPSRLGFPPVSLAEPWLLALLVAAWLRNALAPVPSPARLSAWAWWFGAVVTASLVVTMYPFHLVSDGVDGLLRSVHAFLRDEFLAATQRHPYSPIVAWAIVMEGLGLLWLVLRSFGDAPDGPQRLTRAFAAGAGLVALLGVGQWWTGEGLLDFWIVYDPGLVRVNASFSDVNGLGGFLALGLAAAVGAAIAAPAGSLARRVWFLIAGLIVLCDLFTGSRAAWMAVIVAGVAAGAAFVRIGRPLARAQMVRLTRAAALGLLLLTVVTATLSAYATYRDVGRLGRRGYVDAVLHTLNLNASLDDRLKGRLPYWEAGAAMVRAEPLFGIGIGRFYRQLWAFAPRQEALRRPQENAHNYYLQLAAEVGLTGLAGFLGLVGAALLAGWRAFRRGSSTTDGKLALVLGAGVVAYLLTLVTGHSLIVREGQMAFWPMAGALLILGAGGRTPGGRWGQRALFLGLLALIVALPFRAIRGEQGANLADTWFGLHDLETMRNGTRFQWSTGRFSVYVPREREVFSVEILAVAPFPQRLKVRLDGRLVDEINVRRDDWQTVRYVLPREGRGPRFRKVEFDVDPVWRPPADARELGVIVRMGGPAR
jgi:O-antigen ligase